MFYPVNSRVHDSKLGKSEDNVLSAAVHDIEEMFLDNLFDVCVESVSIANCKGFICCLVHILDCDEGSKFFHKESVFSDELPFYTGYISTRVYQCGGVNDFECVREGDQLNGDSHRSVGS